MSISNYLDDVLLDWKGSRTDFSRNVRPTCQWPIPFFGNPRRAVVATIGVNPSSGEFANGRGWNAIQPKRDWKARLRDYFNPDTSPHHWFNHWRIGLDLLGVSYEAGTATHLDVSYRSTTAMLKNEATDSKEFRRMVERDVQWFFRLLPLCENLRLLLTFGPVLRANGGKQGLLEFLSESAPKTFTVLQDANHKLVLRHEATRRSFYVHDADNRREKCVTCRVVKNLHLHRQELRKRIEV